MCFLTIHELCSYGLLLLSHFRSQYAFRFSKTVDPGIVLLAIIPLFDVCRRYWQPLASSELATWLQSWWYVLQSLSVAGITFGLDQLLALRYHKKFGLVMCVFFSLFRGVIGRRRGREDLLLITEILIVVN